MARRKRSSSVITASNTRAAALESIDPALDLGNGLTLAGFKANIAATQQKLDGYNTQLSALDGLLNDVEAAEKELNDLSVRMLAAVGAKFGRNSSEYEKAGGTRADERKSSLRRPSTTLKAAAA